MDRSAREGGHWQDAGGRSPACDRRARRQQSPARVPGDRAFRVFPRGLAPIRSLHGRQVLWPWNIAQWHHGPCPYLRDKGIIVRVPAVDRQGHGVDVPPELLTCPADGLVQVVAIRAANHEQVDVGWGRTRLAAHPRCPGPEDRCGLNAGKPREFPPEDLRGTKDDHDKLPQCPVERRVAVCPDQLGAPNHAAPEDTCLLKSPDFTGHRARIRFTCRSQVGHRVLAVPDVGPRQHCGSEARSENRKDRWRSLTHASPHLQTPTAYCRYTSIRWFIDSKSQDVPGSHKTRGTS